MKYILLMGLVLVAAGLSACETIKGLGRDITHTGEWVESKF